MAVVPIAEYERVDWNDLSGRGLVERINREILHPIGLAVFYNPATGISGGALVSPDGVWQYPEDDKEGSSSGS